MNIEAEWMRGGTSKCWVFETQHPQHSRTNWDELLPRLFGSPDSRQIDGVGGATSTTSKAMILSRPEDDAVDVEFTFAQVGIEEAAVDWGSNCGNCSAVVGLYAIEKGWVIPDGDSTRIVTRNTNTGQIIIQRVDTPAGALPIVPDAQMPGVVFPGYKVGLGFQDPAGKTTGHLLPTGAPADVIAAGGTRWNVSMIDAGAPVVIVRAEQLGLDTARYDTWKPGVELQLETLDVIRREAAVRMGMVTTPGEAARAVPKLAIVGPPTGPECDVNVMMLSMGRPHPALAITGSIALTLAARTPGTILNAITGSTSEAVLKLRTPAGVIETWSEEHEGTLLVGVDRTARTIATSIIHLPETLGNAVEASLATATR
ncbi:methylitaconate delta2-delta3-isomerase [Paenarthrobacter nitroguajacolicus]|uniref:Methylitaconate delta2-delta3-isomerase n=1 Tax=Paenarthrobacter nitroguajacolicus TaxID=211146 RepID=A0A558HAQ3_PAENT|nr:PrpF domain-containing protein [Paenarthrobacter nitroguajacolicus]TVU66205.1 methylitaconate delta2-delta3-isomerase [Paenarthrobacter nitroguajacolicus]